MTRTRLLIANQLLYQLSYASADGSGTGGGWDKSITNWGILGGQVKPARFPDLCSSNFSFFVFFNPVEPDDDLNVHRHF